MNLIKKRKVKDKKTPSKKIYKILLVVNVILMSILVFISLISPHDSGVDTNQFTREKKEMSKEEKETIGRAIDINNLDDWFEIVHSEKDKLYHLYPKGWAKKTIENFLKDGKTVVSVTHNSEEIRKSDNVIFITEKRKIITGAFGVA